MLLPRFTLRTVLWATTFCAVFFLLVGTAYRGHSWAWGAVIAVLSVGATLLIHAAWYGVAWSCARMFPAQSEEQV